MREAGAHCPNCQQEIDDSRSVETNYTNGSWVVDWYPCAGCLSVLGIEWHAIPGLGDDGWAMFPTDVITPGSVIAIVIERLRAGIAAGDGTRVLDDLRAASDAKRLVRIPEVVEAAWPAFGGHAVPRMHLEFIVTKHGKPKLGDWRVYEQTTELYEARPENVEPLLKLPDDGGVRQPALGPENTHALITKGAKLHVLGSTGPYVRVKPAISRWTASSDVDFKVTLERISLDPDAP